jgi:hypothetical protein
MNVIKLRVVVDEDHFIDIFKLLGVTKGVMGVRLLIEQQQPKSSPSPSPPSSPPSSPKQKHRYTDGHSNKGIRFPKLIHEILTANKGPMRLKEVKSRFSKWPWEGRKGYRFAHATFTAEFGRLVKAGIVIIDNNDYVTWIGEKK